MNKPVRFLIVFIVFFVMIIFSRRNDLHTCPGGRCQGGSVVGKSITTFREEPAALAAPDNSALRQKLVLLEFFSGL
jgi:hypothetical protein